MCHDMERKPGNVLFTARIEAVGNKGDVSFQGI